MSRLPNSNTYVLGYVDEDLQVHLQTDPDVGYKQAKLCALKIENRSGSNLRISMILTADGTPSGVGVEAGQMRFSDQIVPYVEYTLPSSSELAYTGAWCYVDMNGILEIMVDSVKKAEVEIKASANLVRILDDEIRSVSKAAGAAGICSYDGYIRFNDQIESGSGYRYRFTGEHSPPGEEAKDITRVVSVPEWATGVQILDGNTVEETFEILSFRDHAVVIDSPITAKQYAAIPYWSDEHDDWLVDVTNESGEEIHVWAEDGLGYWDPTVGKWLRPAGTPKIPIAAGDTKPVALGHDAKNLKQPFIHWASSGDPKILVRRPTQLGS